MPNIINDRKISHIKAFDVDTDIERNTQAFNRIRLTHRALPNIDFESIDTSIDFLGKKLSFPLIISSMTGGNHELIQNINRNLAQAAEACNVAMSVGSQRVMFSDEQARTSFELRQYAPSTVLIGNIGAVQLNYGFSAQMCQQAVDVLEADALYFHLNPLQEAVQPEGDTNFCNLSEKITDAVNFLNVPVILKEVGSGLSVEDIQHGLNMGITHFDIAGHGGTSWSRIEHQRRTHNNDSLGITFQDWGISTPESLAMAHDYLQQSNNNAHLIASGGLRTGIDIAKSLILGARLGGIAAPLLKPAMTSVEATIEAIKQREKEFKTTLFLLGARTVSDIQNNRNLILNSNNHPHYD